MTILDTFTSLTAGIIIFGILGNLAHETGSDDIKSVVKGGTGVAFVSYPDAISKMEFLPQLFAATFFFMLFVLAIGSNVGMSICLMTAIRDRFTHISHFRVAIFIAVVQFSLGLVYVTEVKRMPLFLTDGIEPLTSIGWPIFAEHCRLFRGVDGDLCVGHCRIADARLDLWRQPNLQ